jgi:hypothetical protein
MMYFNKGNLPW